MISAGPRLVRVWREAGRLNQHEFNLSPGESQVWDRRFVLRRAPGTAGPVTIKPLGAEAYLQIAARITATRRPPARAAYALPSFWAGTELLAVPSLAPFATVSDPPLDPAGCELYALTLSAGY
jgi:tRNA(Ile)-lysidine synthase